MRAREFGQVQDADGNVYRSCNAAARALGYHHSTIIHHLSKYGNLDLLGSGKIPTEKDGVRYESLTEFAKAVGVKRHTLNHHLARHGNLDRAGLGKRGNPGNKSRSNETRIGPMTWPSRKAAAADLGLSKDSLRRYLKPTATARQKDVLMARLMAAHQRHLAAQGAT